MPVLIGGLIAGVGSLAGGIMGANAASDAAAQQAGAANAATNMQKDIYLQNQANMAPWMQAGNLSLQDLMSMLGVGQLPGTGTAAMANTANGSVALPGSPFSTIYNPPSVNSYTGGVSTGTPTGLNSPMLGTQANPMPMLLPAQMMNANGSLGPSYQQILSAVQGGNVTPGTPAQASFNPNAPLVKPFTMADFQADPGYQFQLQQGTQAIENYANAHGMANSPATLKSLGQYVTGLAGQDYQQAFNNYTLQNQNIYNRLAALSGSGLNAAGGVANLGQSAASNIADTMTSGAAAQAAGTVGAANAWTGALSGLGNTAMTAYMLNQMQTPLSTGGTTANVGYGLYPWNTNYYGP